MFTNISGNILSEKSTIKNAIKALQKCKIKIIIITKNKKVIGTITDGDIRRGLLKNISLNAPCFEIMNKNPKCALNNEISRINNLVKSKKIIVVITDKSKNVIGIETSTRIDDEENRDTRVVIMAGGEGKRLMPLTKNTPKPLLHTNKKPIIARIVESLHKTNLTDIYISIRYKGNDIVDYFDKRKDLSVKIKYLREDEPLGTAGCLSMLPKDHTKNTIVINGDILSSINYDQLVNFHSSTKKKVTMCTAQYDISIPFGTLMIKGTKLVDLEEKPTKKFFINAGVYVINNSIIYKLKKNMFCNMTDIIEDNIKKNNVAVFPLHEQWLDIGDHENYKKAQKIK